MSRWERFKWAFQVAWSRGHSLHSFRHAWRFAKSRGPITRQQRLAYDRKIGWGGVSMPSKSAAQARLMRAAAHDKEFAKKVGVPQSAAREFVQADKATKGGCGKKH